MIYVKNGAVGSDMIDADTNLSVIAAFRLVENGVTEMMGKLKIDGITIKKLYGAFWVFTKNAVRFLKPLPWGESFTVESFITAFSVAKLNIETAIKNACGEIAAYAKTELCALDLQTGKIRKTSTVGVKDSFVKEPSLLEINFSKFDTANLAFSESVTVRSTNIDFSRHTNNVEYVRFIMNAYSVEDLLKNPVKQIEVNYISQSYENDELQIYKSSEQNNDIFEIRKEDKPVLRCAISH